MFPAAQLSLCVVLALVMMCVPALEPGQQVLPGEGGGGSGRQEVSTIRKGRFKALFVSGFF